MAAALIAVHNRIAADPPLAAPPFPSSSQLPSAQLIVGDGRQIRLISLGGRNTDRLLTRVAADIAGAVANVEKFWGTDWDREIILIATESASQFVAEAGLDPGQQWDDIAAVSVADHVDLEHRRATGQRIVFAPGAAAMSDAALRIVLTHELFHLAARADTALDAPRWLLEGIADFVARPPTPIPPTAAAAAAARGLPVDADLDVPGPDRSLGYDRAWWFARFVADTYGIDALRQLYLKACGPGHADFAQAVQSALGIDVTNLRDAWVHWLNR